MTNQYPILEIITPEGEEKNIDLASFFENNPDKTEIKIGRLNNNDIILPDPENNISRCHCAIKFEKNTWLIRDENSSNGTFIQRQGEETEIDVRRHEFVALQENDQILILGYMTEDEQPIFWQITFHDDGITTQNQQKRFQAPYQLEYSLRCQKLKRINRYQEETIKLSQQQSQLIDYMAQRNYEEDNQPILCNYNELIEAIWKDQFGHNPNEINRLVWGIRKKIELDSGESEFLQSVRGQGYRLNIKIVE